MAEKRIVKVPRGLERRAADRLTGRYIMAFRQGAQKKVSAALAELGIPAARTKPPKAKVAHPLPHGQHYILPVLGLAVIDPHSELEERLLSLAGRDKDVLSLAPERIFKVVSNSPDYLRGWRDATNALTTSLLTDGASRPFMPASAGTATPGSPDDDWWLTVIGVKASHLTGASIKIGILDTGMDVTHPDFHGRDITPDSFVGDGQDIQDTSGHGTACAGLAAGPLNPRQGARYGVACESSLYVVRVAHFNGIDYEAPAGTIHQGIDAALDKGCQVISISFESKWTATQDDYDQELETTISNALDKHCVVVAAAGNEGRTLGAPGNCPSALTVAAVDRALVTASFSNRKTDNPPRGPDIAAPGVNIRSCTLGGGYGWNSGTSFACPQVAGIAALLAQSDPTLRGRKLKDAVIARCRPLQDPVGEVGHGLVQAP